MDIFWEKDQCTPHIVGSEKCKKLVQASGGCTETWERYGLLVIIAMIRIWSKNITLQGPTKLQQTLDWFGSLCQFFL